MVKGGNICNIMNQYILSQREKDKRMGIYFSNNFDLSVNEKQPQMLVPLPLLKTDSWLSNIKNKNVLSNT